MMSGGVGKAVLGVIAACALLRPSALAEEPPPREAVVQALLNRSRLLQDVRVQVPAGVYREYLRALGRERPAMSDAPVGFLAESGTYHLGVDADRRAALKAELNLWVLDPASARNLPVLPERLAWKDVRVNGRPAQLPVANGWLRHSPEAPGAVTITGEAPLGEVPPLGRQIALDIARTARTFVVFDSPAAWRLRADPKWAPLAGADPGGTHGRIALSPRSRLQLDLSPTEARTQRPPRYELAGSVAWNLDAAVQEVTAALKVTIAAGPSDRVELLIPGDAERVSVTGPEVRQVDVTAGRAVVHLRGPVLGPTPLTVSYERPVRGERREFGPLAVAEGHWTGGTLVVANSAGGSEVLPESADGLRPIALHEIPPDAAGMLTGPPALAYEISARSFSASVEILQLGEFALRQSVADLAHYEVFLDRDGAVIGRVRYEIRNRTRQFLRLELPAGASLVLARVNEKSVPAADAPGARGAWLLPLERSRPSVKGLVSFPVDVVYLCRTAPLGAGGTAEIPLPGIDLPVAYAWGEAYLPAGLSVRRWSGAVTPVDQFTSQTAQGSLDYGYSELIEGYTSRLAAPEGGEVLLGGQRAGGEWEREKGVPLLSKIPVLRSVPRRAQVQDEQSAALLARNYYRAGKDDYDKGDFANAAFNLNKVVDLAPASVEADNARRLLANREMLAGRLEVQDKAARAAAKEVRQELTEQNRRLAYQQHSLVQEGIQLEQAGRAEEARTRLQAAHSLTPILLNQGALQAEIDERLQPAEPVYQRLQTKARAQAGQLKTRVAQLRSSGDYAQALELAKRLRDIDIDGDDDVKHILEDLAVKAAQPDRRYVRMDVRPPGQPPPPSPTQAISPQSFTRRGHEALDEASQVRVYPLKHARAEDVARALRAAGYDEAQGARLAVDSGTNSLVVSAGESQSEKIRSLIESVDAAARGAETALFGTTSLAGGAITLLDRWAGTEGRADGGFIYSPATRPGTRPLAEARAGAPFSLDAPFRGTEPPETHAAIRRLSERAQQGIREGDYGGAADALDLAISLDPTNESLREQRMLLEQAIAHHQKDLQRLTRAEVQGPPAELHEAEIPWYDGLRYPRDWREITTRREPFGATGGGPSDQDRAAPRRRSTRAYDIRDLVVTVPTFTAPTIELDEAANAASQPSASEEKARSIERLIQETVDPTTWRGEASGGIGSIRVMNGQLVVTQTEENQQAVVRLIEQLREATGPRVEEAGNIARQKAAGYIGGLYADGHVHGSGRPDQVVTGESISASQEDGKRLEEFLRANYDWALNRPSPVPAPGEVLNTIQANFTTSQAELVRKLQYNLGQKVPVASNNLNGGADLAAGLGVNWVNGRNGVNFAVIDEGQYRALAELDAAGRQKGLAVARNDRGQEAIVGTDALLANDWTANVTYAGEAGNKLDVYDNSIELSHEKYLLLDNGQFLTVVKAGSMRHWTEKTQPIALADVPQTIEVPRVGRLVKFEKTLLEPADPMTLRVEYRLEGVNP